MAAKPRFRNDAGANAGADAAPDDPRHPSPGDRAHPGGGDRGHPVDETPPPFRTFTSGLQHVTAMYAGVVAPRMIVGCARQLWRSGAESHAPAPA
ncbi:hypothetical protein SSP531S_04870 [Streptomyces spongiicola]|uniref:Uncharacterized protein n=1 Tax=Streptomyces spongiicola TaxID=1690221 RepID=A0A388SR22_9ACTN|nr:hypothetical protein SSP531S_04870 [Streptomyces spongiicola]